MKTTSEEVGSNMESNNMFSGQEISSMIRVPDPSAARKRRAEKLSLKTMGTTYPPSKVISSHVPPAVPLKKRKLSAADAEAPSKLSDSKLRVLKSAVDILSAKRDGLPKQIRYDPEIPVRLPPASYIVGY